MSELPVFQYRLNVYSEEREYDKYEQEMVSRYVVTETVVVSVKAADRSDAQRQVDEIAEILFSGMSHFQIELVGVDYTTAPRLIARM